MPIPEFLLGSYKNTQTKTEHEVYEQNNRSVIYTKQISSSEYRKPTFEIN